MMFFLFFSGTESDLTVVGCYIQGSQVKKNPISKTLKHPTCIFLLKTHHWMVTRGPNIIITIIASSSSSTPIKPFSSPARSGDRGHWSHPQVRCKVTENIFVIVGVIIISVIIIGVIVIIIKIVEMLTGLRRTTSTKPAVAFPLQL